MRGGADSCPPGADGTTPPVLLRDAGASGAFGDGIVSVVLASYLTALGLSDTRIGVVVTATLLGSAALTLARRAARPPRRPRRLLQLVSLLMIVTGLGFAAFTSFWPLLVVAFVGTLNPSGGDVSVFLPTEQALLPGTAPDSQRTALFARYSLVGALVAAVGSLCAGVPEWLGDRVGVATETALRWTFVLYAALGVVDARALPHARRRRSSRPPTRPTSALGPSRRDRVPARRAVQPRLVRRRLRAHRARRAVAAEPLRPVARRQRRGLLLGRCAVGVLGARRGADRRRASASCARWSSPTSPPTAS